MNEKTIKISQRKKQRHRKKLKRSRRSSSFQSTLRVHRNSRHLRKRKRVSTKLNTMFPLALRTQTWKNC